MSYDISLVDPGTKETIHLDKSHTLKGGTYCPGGTREATFNITYNYAPYFYTYMDEEKGIRCLYGLTGKESISIIDDTINRIKFHDCNNLLNILKNYRDDFQRPEFDTTKNISNTLITDYDLDENDMIIILLKSICMEISNINKERNQNYWNSTRENVIRSLENLKQLAELAPHGIWDGD